MKLLSAMYRSFFTKEDRRLASIFHACDCSALNGERSISRLSVSEESTNSLNFSQAPSRQRGSGGSEFFWLAFLVFFSRQRATESLERLCETACNVVVIARSSKAQLSCDERTKIPRGRRALGSLNLFFVRLAFFLRR